MFNSVELTQCFQDLENLNKYQKGEFPSLYKGKISDPTSFTEAFLICFKQGDPAVVNEYLSQVIKQLGEAIKEKTLIDKESKTILSSIQKLGTLALTYHRKMSDKSDEIFTNDPVYWSKLSTRVTTIKQDLERIGIEKGIYKAKSLKSE